MSDTLEPDIYLRAHAVTAEDFVAGCLSRWLRNRGKSDSLSKGEILAVVNLVLNAQQDYAKTYHTDTVFHVVLDLPPAVADKVRGYLRQSRLSELVDLSHRLQRAVNASIDLYNGRPSSDEFKVRED